MRKATEGWDTKKFYKCPYCVIEGADEATKPRPSEVPCEAPGSATDEFRKLLTAFGNAHFDCGESDIEPGDEYQKLINRTRELEKKILGYFK